MKANCPNCGAPYKLGVPVCEYCGTIREDFEDKGDDYEVMKTLDGRTVSLYGYVPAETPPPYPRRISAGARDVSTGEITWVSFDPPQQTANGAQQLANAAEGMIYGFDQAQRETEQLRASLKVLRFNAAQQAQFDNIAFPIPRPAPFPTLPPPPVFIKREDERHEALSTVKTMALVSAAMLVPCIMRVLSVVGTISAWSLSAVILSAVAVAAGIANWRNHDE